MFCVWVVVPDGLPREGTLTLSGRVTEIDASPRITPGGATTFSSVCPLPPTTLPWKLWPLGMVNLTTGALELEVWKFTPVSVMVGDGVPAVLGSSEIPVIWGSVGSIDA